MYNPIQVYTTTGSREEALRIAGLLVEERLAACAQVSQEITSVYRWKGVLETAAEWGCTIKSDGRLLDQLRQRIRDLHSYDVPAILVTQLSDVNAEYVEWVEEQLNLPS